jgi:hypothetical protein
MGYKRLTNEELNEFLSRVFIQLEPELAQQMMSVANELLQYRNKIENGTLVELPKYKLNQKVYVLPLNNSIGTIDGYDLFKHKYLVYIECGDEFGKLGFGNEWFTEQELSATKPKPKRN